MPYWLTTSEMSWDFPGARQGAMVEKETVDIATGEVSRERWYLLTSLSSRQ